MDMTTISVETANRVFEILDVVSTFYGNPENFSSTSKVDEFSDEIYPKLHELYYKTRILDSWDDEFVSLEGSDDLFILAGDPDTKFDEPNSIVVARHDLRLVFILVEDLQQYFHQPGHWSSDAEVQQFAQEIQPRLRDACGRIKQTWGVAQ